MFYGLIGGVLGCVAGVWLLGALSKGITSAYSIPNKSAIVYNWGQLVVSFIITLLVCVIAAARPVMKASSLSLREIMLDKSKHAYKEAWYSQAHYRMYIVNCVNCNEVCPCKTGIYRSRFLKRGTIFCFTDSIDSVYYQIIGYYRY
jgi:hypothetical protein